SIFILLIISGGLGFVVFLDFWGLNADESNMGIYQRMQNLNLQTKIVLLSTAFLLCLGFLIFFCFEYQNNKTMADLSPGSKILCSLFQSVTCRTAGFNSLDFGQMNTQTQFSCLFLFLIGASPASTGGGLKTTTFAILVLAAFTIIMGRKRIRLFNREIAWELATNAFIISFLYILFLFSTVALLIFEPNLPLIKIVFEACSAIGTVGLSTGITATLTSASRVVIIFLMFFGRIGPLSLFLAFSDAKHADEGSLRFPEEHIGVG
ncbi:potassium transporter TrkG, partial [Candidatus Riflebacteria bacterium]